MNIHHIKYNGKARLAGFFVAASFFIFTCPVYAIGKTVSNQTQDSVNTPTVQDASLQQSDIANTTDQSSTSPDMSNEEKINSFDATIVLNKDSTVSIKEKIVYDFAGNERHGLERFITLASAPGTFDGLNISDVLVTDENGVPYQLSQNNSSGIIDLRAGDPNQTITGVHTYIVQYIAKNAIGFSSDRDEIYWNATGNQWDVPIESATTEVFIPGDHASADLHIASYCGEEGSKNPCTNTSPVFHSDTNQTEVDFASNPSTVLDPGSGMTVAVGFPKGVITSPTQMDYVIRFLKHCWFYPLPLLVAIFWFRKSFQFWLRRRKYYQQNTIIAQYDAGAFSPLEAAVIVNGGIADKDLSAQIISLAVRGYVTIKNTDDEYSFVATGKNQSDLSASDKKLLTGIVGETESDLIDSFYTTAREIKSTITESLTIREYTLKSIISGVQSGRSNRFVSLFIGCFLALNPGIFVWILGGFQLGYIFSASCILIALVHVVVNPRGNQLTDKGLDAEHALLGLKLYISVAEEDRIKFHDAPEKKPEIFEKLLPYAMIFGLENEWAKQFESIYTVAPTWYSGSNAAAFSVIAFGSSMHNFSSGMGLAMFSAPASSSGGGGSFGSSGGGFSGGGGGGGGGGSW